MQQPILSICIPTYNRSEYLNKTLKCITSSEIFVNTNLIEIVISDNCSTDKTEKICNKFTELFPEKIKYIRQEEPVTWGEHLFKVLKYGNGKYLKLNNDTCYFKEGMLEETVNCIMANSDADFIFIQNNDNQSIKTETCNTFDSFLKKVSYDITWIGAFCPKKELYMKLIDTIDSYYTVLPQVDFYGKLFENNYSIEVVSGSILCVQTIVKKKGNYNIAEVFGQNYLNLLKLYVKKNILSKKVYETEKQKVLTKHINKFYFDVKEQYAFAKTGYFKYLFKDYWYEPYFYFAYVLTLIKKFLYWIVRIEKDSTCIKFAICGFIRVRIGQKNNIKKDWIKRNRHNHTFLVSTFQSEKISVGKATYGAIDAFFSSDDDSKLIIGNFCSIASGVKFLVSSDHEYKNLSTYPFKSYFLDYSLEAVSKGSIIIKDDVWLGFNSIILSGVTIGQGAIVAAGSVVTKDVPPYAIVGGNPARVIKYRFEPEIVEKLVKFDFSKLTDEKIKEWGNALYSEITKDNIDRFFD